MFKKALAAVGAALAISLSPMTAAFAQPIPTPSAPQAAVDRNTPEFRCAPAQQSFDPSGRYAGCTGTSANPPTTPQQQPGTGIPLPPLSISSSGSGGATLMPVFNDQYWATLTSKEQQDIIGIQTDTCTQIEKLDGLFDELDRKGARSDLVQNIWTGVRTLISIRNFMAAGDFKDPEYRTQLRSSIVQGAGDHLVYRMDRHVHRAFQDTDLISRRLWVEVMVPACRIHKQYAATYGAQLQAAEPTPRQSMRRRR